MAYNKALTKAATEKPHRGCSIPTDGLFLSPGMPALQHTPYSTTARGPMLARNDPTRWRGHHDKGRQPGYQRRRVSNWPHLHLECSAVANKRYKLCFQSRKKAQRNMSFFYLRATRCRLSAPSPAREGYLQGREGLLLRVLLGTALGGARDFGSRRVAYGHSYKWIGGWSSKTNKRPQVSEEIAA